MIIKPLIYKDIKPGYTISEYGDIYNSSGYKLKPYINEKGYKQYNLARYNKRRSVEVHRLVAHTFIGECPEGLVVNHKDADKLNCHVSNLEYVTPYENANHAKELDLYEVLEERYNSSLSNNQVHEICYLLEIGCSYDEIHSLVKVNHDVLKKIASKKNWTRITDMYTFPEVNRSAKYDDKLKQSIQECKIEGLSIKETIKRLKLDESYRHLIKRERRKVVEGSTTNEPTMIFKVRYGCSRVGLE